MLQEQTLSGPMLGCIIAQVMVTWASVAKSKHCHSKLGQCCKGKQFLGRCWARAWRHADDAPESVDFYLEKNKQNPALLLNNVFLKSSYTIHNFANARYVFMPSVLFLLGFSFPIWRRSVRPEPPACSNERCT